MKKPYSESCDQNREPILSIIKPLLADCMSVLEIGSGTGQHAVFFARSMPHLYWYTSDCEENLPGIQLWIDDAHLENISDPCVLDVLNSKWPEKTTEAVFSANTAHIMSRKQVEAMLSGIGALLSKGNKFMLYGPFNYNNSYTSESNKRFDEWLQDRDPLSGIRDFEELNRLAERAGLVLQEDYEMPVNNRLLYWKKA